MQQIAPDAELDVLFVEDEPDNRLVLMARFAAKLRCAAAADAAEALALLETRRVAVLVSDQRMPGMTGIDLCEQVRDRWPEMRRILLTADSERASAIDAINRGGVHHYVDKPWQPQRLDSLLRAEIAEVRAGQAGRALHQSFLDRERLAAADAMRRELLHDLASATSVADLGYDAVADACAALPPTLPPDVLADLREGLAALRQGLDYVGKLQADLRAAVRTERQPRQERVGELIELGLRLTGAHRRGDIRRSGALDRVIHVDRVAVCRILVNLLSNACEAAEGSGKPVRVEIEAIIDAAAPGHEPRMCVAVEDHGPGIDPAVRERIFDRGFTTRKQGNGLGLPLARDLARLEGGDLRLAPPIHGSGTRFELCLPLADEV
ncbi:MAG: response regulator [Deltaproteobacteria bacterium]|nr:response regulator [Deltaproteobacteria bacterium]